MEHKQRFDLTQEKISLKGKSSTWRKSAEVFLADVVFLAQNGYELNPNPTSREMANFRGGFPVASMVKVGSVKEETPVVPAPVAEHTDVVPDIKDIIGAMTNKQEMLDWAKDKGIDVPKDKKNPAAIKAFLLKAV
jgi:hypothetical protein